MSVLCTASRVSDAYIKKWYLVSVFLPPSIRKKTHMELEPPGDSSLPLSPSSPLQR